MPRFALEVKAQLQGVSSFGIPETVADEYPWHISLLCGSCGEKSQKPVVVSRGDEVDGIRGATVSLKIKCKLCGRVNDLTILKNVTSTYTFDDSPSWKKFLEIEARGTEPTAVEMSDDEPISVLGDTGYGAEEAVIADNEYYGFDEKLNQEMVISEFESRVVKM